MRDVLSLVGREQELFDEDVSLREKELTARVFYYRVLSAGMHLGKFVIPNFFQNNFSRGPFFFSLRMSVMPLKAEVAIHGTDVRYVPNSDIQVSHQNDAN